jgi:hypothetical protein
LVPNTLTSPQTTLASISHLADGQFLLEVEKLCMEKSLIYQSGTQTADSKREEESLKSR